MELLDNLIHGNGLFHILPDGFMVLMSLIGLKKVVYDGVMFHGSRVTISQKCTQIATIVCTVFGSVVIIVFMWSARGVPELLDLPYELSNEYPRIYGTIVSNEKGAIVGIKDNDTGEILYEHANNIGHPKLKEYDVQEGTYVEAMYTPYTKRLRIIRTGEEAEFCEAIMSDKYSLEAVNEKVEPYGVGVGAFYFLLSSGWSSWYVLRRLKKHKVTAESTSVIRYELFDGISILLATMPLMFANLIFIGSWLQHMPIELSSRLIWICLLVWLAGILLEAVSYHTTLVFGEEEFYIGVSECVQKTYKKADIQSIEWREGNIMEITMNNGKKIRGRAEKDKFEIIKRKLCNNLSGKEQEMA